MPHKKQCQQTIYYNLMTQCTYGVYLPIPAIFCPLRCLHVQPNSILASQIFHVHKNSRFGSRPGSMEVRPGKDGVISQQMSTTVMSTGRPFTKLIKDSALSFGRKRVLPKHWTHSERWVQLIPDLSPSLSLDMFQNEHACNRSRYSIFFRASLLYFSFLSYWVRMRIALYIALYLHRLKRDSKLFCNALNMFSPS